MVSVFDGGAFYVQRLVVDGHAARSGFFAWRARGPGPYGSGWGQGVRPPAASAASSGAPRASSPRALKGGEKTEGAKIDWLSFSLLWASDRIPDLLAVLRGWLSADVAAEGRGGYQGFESSLRLAAFVNGEVINVGLIAFGGAVQRGRVYVSLTGAGCNLLRAPGDLSAWLQLQTDDGREPRITRVDLAVDDMAGRFTVPQVARWYKAGAFDVQGRRPSHRCEGDWIVPSGAGRTFYVGRRQNGKMLRVYEKGKQLGDRNSPWVRFEVEFRNKDRVIPFNVLVDPDRYFVGAYAPLSRVLDGAGTRIRTVKKSFQISLSALVGHAKTSYGSVVGVLCDVFGNDFAAVVDQLRKPGLPRRLAESRVALGVYGCALSPG